MIEVEPDAPVTVYDCVALKDFIASLFDGRVDAVDCEGLQPYLRPMARGEASFAG